MPPRRRLHRQPAFTLVELLVAMVVTLILLVVLVAMVNQTSAMWRSTDARIEQFRGARVGFASLTRRLSQATLNTYLDFVDSNGKPRVYSGNPPPAFVPYQYARQSELRYLSGAGLAGTLASAPPRPTQAVFFQAPLGFVVDSVAADATAYGGLANLLNTWGYYVEFNSDGSSGTNADGTGLNLKPSFVKTPARYRFRLMELMQASERLSLYNYTASNPGLTSTQTNGMNWFTDALPPLAASAQPPVTWSHVLAENVVALILLPKLSPGDQAAGNYTDASLAPHYTYDSTLPGAGTTDPNLDSQTQLPPIVTVTMVAVDEASYSRFQGSATTAPASLGLGTLFQTVGDTKNPGNAGFAMDLQTLENNLRNNRLNYRVFTTDVSIKGAKWSRSQAD